VPEAAVDEHRDLRVVKAMSGRPGRPETFARNRMPRRCSDRRRDSSGLVPALGWRLSRAAVAASSGAGADLHVGIATTLSAEEEWFLSVSRG